MMRKNLQLSFATYEASLKMSAKDPVRIAFEQIDWKKVYEMVATKYSTKGRDGYDPVSMFKALLLRYFGEVSSDRQLARRLRFDIRWCYLCGFHDFLNTPSHAAFTQFRQRLGDKLFSEIYHMLIQQAASSGIFKTKDFALDATDISAFSNPKGKKSCSCEDKSCGCLRKISDPDARWGHKSETQKFFGYKLHVLVEKSSQLPVASIVTGGNAYDPDYAIPLVKQNMQKHPEVSIENVAADAIFDTHKVYKGLYELGITPFIPLKSYPNPRLLGELTVSNDGWRCIAGHRLVNWGYCKDRKRHKLRCPHVLGKVNCLLRDACSTSAYGRVFYIHPTDDLRLVGNVPRGTPAWAETYKARTSAERLFAELKGRHRLDDLLVRGEEQVTIHTLLAQTALVLKRLASNGSYRRGPPDA